MFGDDCARQIRSLIEYTGAGTVADRSDTISPSRHALAECRDELPAQYDVPLVRRAAASELILQCAKYALSWLSVAFIFVRDESSTYVGSFDTKSIEAESATVRVGDGLYDTEYDRVLWVSRIDGSGVTVEPVTDYETEEQIGWPPGGRSQVVTTGTTFAPTEFIALVDSGRLEVAPR